MADITRAEGPILVEEVDLLLHGIASMYRGDPAGRRLSGGGLATLRVVRRRGSVTVTIAVLDFWGIDLDVSGEAWAPDAWEVDPPSRSGAAILSADGEASEWHTALGGRVVTTQGAGSFRVVDAVDVLRATLSIRDGAAMELTVTREEWARGFATSSGRSIAAAYTQN